jgi:hypothetical protein
VLYRTLGIAVVLVSWPRYSGREEVRELKYCRVKRPIGNRALCVRVVFAFIVAVFLIAW